MAHTHNRLESTDIQDLNNLPTHLLQTVGFLLPRFIGRPVAEEIRDDESKATVGEELDLVAPIVGGAGEAVEEEHMGLGVLCRDVHVAICHARGEFR